MQQGIRAVKLYAYETEFVKKVLDIREKELSGVLYGLLVRALSRSISSGAPLLVSVVSLAVFALLGNTIDVRSTPNALSL